MDYKKEIRKLKILKLEEKIQKLKKTLEKKEKKLNKLIYNQKIKDKIINKKNKNELKNILQNNFININYTKKNGENRNFIDATLKKEIIEPIIEANKTFISFNKYKENNNDKLITVYVTSENSWKTLIIDNINNIEIIKNKK